MTRLQLAVAIATEIISVVKFGYRVTLADAELRRFYSTDSLPIKRAVEDSRRLLPNGYKLFTSCNLEENALNAKDNQFNWLFDAILSSINYGP